MNALRWCLGLVAGIGLAGFVVHLAVANGFRRSFGASENNPMLVVLIVAALALLLAGVVAPGNRVLLHLGAVAALALGGFCIRELIKEPSTVQWLGLGYMAAWLVFYGITLAVAYRSAAKAAALRPILYDHGRVVEFDSRFDVKRFANHRHYVLAYERAGDSFIVP